MMISMGLAGGMALLVATIMQSNARSVIQNQANHTRDELANQIRKSISNPRMIAVTAQQAGGSGVPATNLDLKRCIEGTGPSCTTTSAVSLWLYEQITQNGAIQRVGGNAAAPKFYDTRGNPCADTVTAADGRCRIRVVVTFQPVCPSPDMVNPASATDCRALPNPPYDGGPLPNPPFEFAFGSAPAEVIKLVATISDATPAAALGVIQNFQFSTATVSADVLTCQIRFQAAQLGYGGPISATPHCQ